MNNFLVSQFVMIDRTPPETQRSTAAAVLLQLLYDVWAAAAEQSRGLALRRSTGQLESKGLVVRSSQHTEIVTSEDGDARLTKRVSRPIGTGCSPCWRKRWLLPLVLMMPLVVASVCVADEPPKGEWRRSLSLKQAVANIEHCIASGELVVDVDVKVQNEAIRFDLGIGPNPHQLGWVYRLNLSQVAFRRAEREFESAGYRLAVTDSVRWDDREWHSGVWVQDAAAEQTLQLPDLPVPISGEENPELADVDRLMTEFLLGHNVAGATVAIAHRGKLLYSRGFGWADLESETAMSPDSEMRIASVSKPITAVAIMRLADDGALKLSDSVVSWLRKLRLKKPVDQRWNDITILHLLQHTGGWDRMHGSDPVFRPAEAQTVLKLRRTARPRDLVAWQLKEPLDFEPGTRTRYCNFGYCVLGRIVEAASGQDYVDYVTEQLLDALGMSQTRPGRTRLKDRGKREVRCYMQHPRRSPAVWSLVAGRRKSSQPQVVDRPYGAWDLEVLDSCAGWVSTAPDLVTFVSQVFDESSGLLSSEAMATMTEAPGHIDPDAVSWYGCGWNVVRAPWTGRGHRGPGTVSHYGTLDGSGALLVRRDDGYAWTVLFNTDRSSSGELLAPLLDGQIDRLLP